jgi:hypothetical protein
MERLPRYLRRLLTKQWLCSMLVLGMIVSLLGCATPTPTPILVTPTPAPTATPTPTPTATPTPTPIPPLALTIRQPTGDTPSLPYEFIKVEIRPPAGVSVSPRAQAMVVDPSGSIYQHFDLVPEVGHQYRSLTPLRLPLMPITGTWRVVVAVESTLPVTGAQKATFEPAPPAFHDLSGVLPEETAIQIPEIFAEVETTGDAWAGKRVWRYEGGEIGLWWAPGPVEPLAENTAQVMWEATWGDDPPLLHAIEVTTWDATPAFHFIEESKQGEGWVMQDASYRLYALRVRAIDGPNIPALMHEVAATFHLHRTP